MKKKLMPSLEELPAKLPLRTFMILRMLSPLCPLMV